MPSFGQTTAEGTILAWLKREGDPVRRGEPLADVETDKTTVQVEAYAAGYVRRIVQPAGSVVAAGDTIAVLTSSPDEAIEDLPHPTPEVEVTPPPVGAEAAPARPAARPASAARSVAAVASAP